MAKAAGEDQASRISSQDTSLASPGDRWRHFHKWLRSDSNALSYHPRTVSLSCVPV